VAVLAGGLLTDFAVGFATVFAVDFATVVAVGFATVVAVGLATVLAGLTGFAASVWSATDRLVAGCVVTGRLAVPFVADDRPAGSSGDFPETTAAATAAFRFAAAGTLFTPDRRAAPDELFTAVTALSPVPAALSMVVFPVPGPPTFALDADSDPALRVAFARTAMASPIYKRARDGTPRTPEGGKNTERMRVRQTCHTTWADRDVAAGYRPDPHRVIGVPYPPLSAFNPAVSGIEPRQEPGNFLKPPNHADVVTVRRGRAVALGP
jgi:hypothetical protein